MHIEMREVSFEESKEIMVNILKSIDKCCRENNINYSLCWGTLIGAIRHHGFIPWDDDIDLMMSRKEYNRFLEVYNDSEYGVYTPKVNKNCIQPMTKVYDKKTRVYLNNHSKSLFGVWVSIFPYDNAPDENIVKWEKKRDFWSRLYHIKTCQRLIRERSAFRKFSKQVSKLVLTPFSSFWIYKRLENCLTAYNNQQTSRVCIWFGTPYMKFRYFPKELMNEFVDVDFEQMRAMVIKRYDDFLMSTYGDYMMFPPESEQVPKHNYRAYFLEQ